MRPRPLVNPGGFYHAKRVGDRFGSGRRRFAIFRRGDALTVSRVGAIGNYVKLTNE